jgi:hypothetical protein
MPSPDYAESYKTAEIALGSFWFTESVSQNLALRCLPGVAWVQVVKETVGLYQQENVLLSGHASENPPHLF